MKTWLLFVFALAPALGFSQRGIDKNRTLTEKTCQTLPDKTGEFEILYPGNWENATEVVMYQSDEWGYVTGNNNYDDMAKGQVFQIMKPCYIYSAYFWFGDIQGTGGTLEFNIWSFNEEPGELIHTQTIPAHQVSASDDINDAFLVEFDPPVRMDSDFMMGFGLANLDSTIVGLWSSINGDGGGLGLAWEQWSDESWYPFNHPSGWNLDIDLAIFPVIIWDAEDPDPDPDPDPEFGMISQLRVNQRQDGSGLLDIYYNLEGELDRYFVEADLSLDGGASFIRMNKACMSGDFLPATTGTDKHLVYDAGQCSPGTSTHQAKIRLNAVSDLNIIYGPAGTYSILPPSYLNQEGQLQMLESSATAVVKPGQQAASVAVTFNITDKQSVGGMDDYEISFPVLLKVDDPERLRVNVKLMGDIILPLHGIYNAASRTYSIKTFGIVNNWVMCVVDAEPMAMVSSVSAKNLPVKKSPNAAKAWSALDFTIFDDSQLPSPFSESIIRDHILTVARDALITLQSNGFKAPKLQLDPNGGFQLFLIDREKIAGLGSASYYEPPDQQHLGRIYINYPPFIPDYGNPAEWKLGNVIIHETFHAVQNSYDLEELIEPSAFNNNKNMYASSAYLEGTATLIGGTYGKHQSIGPNTAEVDHDFGVHMLDHAIDDFFYSSPYEKQDFFAFLSKRFFNGNLQFFHPLFESIHSFAPVKLNASITAHLLKYRKGLHAFLSKSARPLPEAYTEYAMERIYLHSPAYLLRSNESPEQNSWFVKNRLNQSVLTVNKGHKKWESKSTTSIEYDDLVFSDIRPLSAVAATMTLPPDIEADNRPDSISFHISLSADAQLNQVMEEEGIRIMVIRATDEFGFPAENDPIVVVQNNDKPVRVSIKDGVSHLIFIAINAYVEEVTTNITIKPGDLQPPVLHISPKYFFDYPDKPSTLQMLAENIPPNIQKVTFDWDFGDATSTSAGVSPEIPVVKGQASFSATHIYTFDQKLTDYDGDRIQYPVNVAVKGTDNTILADTTTMYSMKFPLEGNWQITRSHTGADGVTRTDEFCANVGFTRNWQPLKSLRCFAFYHCHEAWGAPLYDFFIREMDASTFKLQLLGWSGTFWPRYLTGSFSDADNFTAQYQTEQLTYYWTAKRVK
jgi:hypothetical protein